jgi:hypothetical protein
VARKRILVSQKTRSLRRGAIAPKAERTSNSKRGATPTGEPAAKAGDPQAASLSLRFPTEAELQRLEELANTRPESQINFFGNINSLIQEAHYFHKLFHAGPKKYRAALERLQRIATHLHAVNAELDGVVEAGQSANGDPEKTFAYDFLNEAIDRSPGPWQSDRRLAKHVQKLSDFLAVSQRAEQQAKAIWGRRGRRTGAGGNYAFNIFVQQLYLTAWTSGGRFTNARNKDPQQWSGSLVEVLEILRPYLPSFFPPAEIGRAAQNIVDQLRAHMNAHRSQYRRQDLRTKNRRSRP